MSLETPRGCTEKHEAEKIPSFTGISAPYEPPKNADLVLKNDQDATLDGAVSRLMDFLKQNKVRA